MSVAEDGESPEALWCGQGAGLDCKVWQVFDLHLTIGLKKRTRMAMEREKRTRKNDVSSHIITNMN